MSELLDASVIKIFADTTNNILSTMAQAECTVQDPELKSEFDTEDFIKTGMDKTVTSVIRANGMIGLAGKKLKGTLVLVFPAETITKIASAMLFTEYTEVNSEVQDCICELANMVSGGSRAALAEAGKDLDMALPICIVGERSDIFAGSAVSPTIIPFKTNHGNFYLEVSLVEKS